MRILSICITAAALSLTWLSGKESQADLVGLWTFENPNNIGQATIGSDLTFKSTGVGITNGSGGDDTGAALVDINQGIFVQNPIGGNGGGSRTNQYTIIMDIQRRDLDSTNQNFHAIVQFGTSNNEADLFFRNGDPGIGISGNYDGDFFDDNWMRLALVVDLNAAAGERMRAYRDGSFVRNIPPVQNIDGRWSMGQQFLLLADGIGDPVAGGEEGLTAISNLALFSRPLTSAEIASFGGPGTAIPEPSTAVLLIGGLSLMTLNRRKR